MVHKHEAPADAYWLSRCERWQVFAPDGRVGSVRAVLYGSRLDMPETLLVERGLFRKQTLAVSPDAVERVLPTQRRLMLRRRPPASSEAAVLPGRLSAQRQRAGALVPGRLEQATDRHTGIIEVPD